MQGSKICRMIDLLHKADRGMAPCPHHHIRLNESFRSDLRWWLIFCSQWNGVSCWFPPTVVHRWSCHKHREPGVVVLNGTLPGSSCGGHLGHTTSQSQLRNFSQLSWRQQPGVHYGKDNTSSVVVTTRYPVSLEPTLSYDASTQVPLLL